MDTSLLQELLVALLGYDGDVFVDSCKDRNYTTVGPPDQQPYTLSDVVDWVPASEKMLLNQMAQLGYHFGQIKHFIDHQVGEKPGRGSMYKRALAAGLAELLDVFQATVLQMQQYIMTDNLPVLAKLQFYLGDFQVILPAVHKLLFEAEKAVTSYSGALILKLLHERSQCGMPTLQSVMQRLLWHCNQVLFRQLSAWIVHGVLLDQRHEFFVKAADGEGAAAVRLPAAKPKHGTGPADEAAYAIWHGGFCVDLARLPHFISAELADTIVFIGKAVQVLRQPAGEFRHQELLPHRETLGFAEAMRRLQEAPTMNRVALERTLEAVRANVAGRLWHLLVVQAGLTEQLQAMKDYFLLARGDLFHCFLDEARPLMARPPRPATVEVDIAVPFQQAALKTSAQHDRLFRLFHLRYRDKDRKVALGLNSSVEVPRFDLAWDGLALECSVEWPLGLLITPSVLEKYEAMFQMLLRLKRVQMRLEDAWKLLCRRSVRQDDPLVFTVLQLRHQMAHFVTNLQIYIQVDVIESNFQVLEERIAGARDFLAAEQAHSAYLAALLSQSLLNMATIVRQMSGVFGAIMELCIMVDAAMRQETASFDAKRVQELAADYRTKVGGLYTNLASRQLQEANKAPHLRQLMLRLDYNSFVGGRTVRAALAATSRAGAAAGLGSTRPAK